MYFSRPVNFEFNTNIDSSLLETDYASVSHLRSQSNPSQFLMPFCTIDAQMAHMSLEYNTTVPAANRLSEEQFYTQAVDTSPSSSINVDWVFSNSQNWSTESQSTPTPLDTQHTNIFNNLLNVDSKELSSYPINTSSYIPSPYDSGRESFDMVPHTLDQKSVQSCGLGFSGKPSFSELSAYDSCFDSPKSMLLDFEYTVDDSQKDVYVPTITKPVWDPIPSTFQTTSRVQKKVPRIARPARIRNNFPSSTAATKEHRCNICGYRTNRSNNLLRHKGSHMREVKEWECDKCTKSYSSRSNLVRHASKVHQ
ncbi:hypothetical protein CLU79DRAFT_765444 [Phycomyces nitens]|nr:hypothetical protein CLU79DRAFT_765444 [Phycomyces nitens]